MSVGTENEPAELVMDDGDDAGTIDLGRVLWLITVSLLLLGMTILAFKRDWGYAGVSLAVALSAGINLI